MKLISSSSDVAQNLIELKTQITNACNLSGRNPAQIHVVAVSKGQPLHLIEQAYACGQRDFGESYAIEMAEKIKVCSSLGMNDIRWHFIGTIQSNKIKLITMAHVIHSLSKLEHARLLEQGAPNALDVFLQVNLGLHPERQGFREQELPHAIESCKHFKQLRLQGLMTILPLTPEKPTNFWFARMQQLRRDLSKPHSPALALSMGMSSDFLEAIACGADILRIGTKIFKSRSQASGE